MLQQRSKSPPSKKKKSNVHNRNLKFRESLKESPCGRRSPRYLTNTNGTDRVNLGKGGDGIARSNTGASASVQWAQSPKSKFP